MIKFIPTRDGTWTASFGLEPMHSLEGALSETEKIYITPLALTVKTLKKPLSILSVGLGLGYFELGVMMLNLDSSFFERITSCEKDSGIRQRFQKAYYNNFNANEKTNDISLSIIEAWSQYPFMKNEPKVIPVEFFGSLSLTQMPSGRFHFIAYDPFSARSNPELWSDEFLSRFLGQLTAEDCVFSTYAKTGTLTRALKKEGFEVLPRRGFGKKRESTLAVRSKDLTAFLDIL